MTSRTGVASGDRDPGGLRGRRDAGPMHAWIHLDEDRELPWQVGDRARQLSRTLHRVDADPQVRGDAAERAQPVDLRPIGPDGVGEEQVDDPPGREDLGLTERTHGEPTRPTCDLEAADADALVGLGVGPEADTSSVHLALKAGDVRVEPRAIDTRAGVSRRSGRVGTMSGAGASVVIAAKSGVAVDVAPDERASSAGKDGTWPGTPSPYPVSAITSVAPRPRQTVEQRALVERARRGDDDAFAVLAGGAIARLDSAARLILQNPSSRGRGPGDAPPSLAIVAGVARPRRVRHVAQPAAHARRDRRGETSPSSADRGGAGAHRCTDHGPDGGSVRPRRDRRAFGRLPADQRAVIVLHFYLDLPLAETAASLGIPVGTAKSRINRAVSAIERPSKPTPDLGSCRCPGVAHDHVRPLRPPPGVRAGPPRRPHRRRGDGTDRLPHRHPRPDRGVSTTSGLDLHQQVDLHVCHHVSCGRTAADPVRILVAVALIALVIAGGLLVAGTRSHLPAPFGEAANGLIAYSNEGDILTVDPVTGKTTTIVGTGDVDHDPTWSRDGTHLAFVRDDSGPSSISTWQGTMGRRSRASPRRPAEHPRPGVLTRWS